MDISSVKSEAQAISTFLKALSNEKRLLIVCALTDKERCVSELEEIIGLSQSALSQHLARLRQDRILSTRREAQTVYYSLPHEYVKEFLGCLNHISHKISGR